MTTPGFEDQPAEPSEHGSHDKLVVAALVLSALDLIGVLSQANRGVDYSDEVARGVGAWLFPLGLAIVAIVLAATGLSRAGRRGERRRVPAIIAIVLAGLAITLSSRHLAALTLTFH